jgi:predicted nucleic acid-binding protein
MQRIFIDSDIILDLFAKREPFHQHAAELFSLVEKRAVKAFVSPIIMVNLNYVLRKLKNKEQAVKCLRKLKLLVKILPVDEKAIELALVSEFTDFEDAVQYYVAKMNGMDFLLTRNTKDYKKADITVMTAEEYLDLYNNRSN